VASHNGSSGAAALRYASALVDLAMESNAIPQIEQDVRDLQAMVAGSDALQSLIRSPLIGADAQQAALAALADTAKFHALTRNFLLLLAQNRRLSALDAILKAVTDTLSARRGEVRARCESAQELSAAQKKMLEENLSKTIGHPVAVDAKVNPDLIGGVVVTLGSVMIDDSVKTKLERLGRAMKAGDTQAA